MIKIDVQITDIEIGYGWLTVWGIQHSELLQLATKLYPHLPKEVRDINLPHLSEHNPPIFHPYGQGKETGRKYYKHFHVLFPLDSPPGLREVEDLWKILTNMTTTPDEDLFIYDIEDHISDTMSVEGVRFARRVSQTGYKTLLNERYWM